MTPDSEFDGKYVLAVGRNPDEFTANVEGFVETGFRLWGPPFSFMGAGPGKESGMWVTMLAQALIR